MQHRYRCRHCGGAGACGGRYRGCQPQRADRDRAAGSCAGPQVCSGAGRSGVYQRHPGRDGAGIGRHGPCGCTGEQCRHHSPRRCTGFLRGRLGRCDGHQPQDAVFPVPIGGAPHAGARGGAGWCVARRQDHQYCVAAVLSGRHPGAFVHGGQERGAGPHAPAGQ
ncbi:hypothetical protein D3C72_1620960 [compost metagenome]